MFYKLKILIFGYGSSGKRYHKIIKKNFPLIELKIFSLNKKNKNKVFIKKYSEIKSFMPKLTIVCSPSSKRKDIIRFLIKLKSNLLIEKPIAANCKDAKKILLLIKKNKIITKIGYNLRFLNSLKILNTLVKSKKLGKIYFVNICAGQNITEWRKNINYTKTVSAKKELGGGVLLELSHEIDYAKWIFGNFNKIFCKVSKVSNLKVNVEDNAKILLFSKNKFTVSINLDFCRKDKIRKCEVVGAKGTLVWNGLNNQLIYYNPTKKKWSKISLKKNDIKSTYFLQLKEMFTLCTSKKKIDVNLVDYIDAYKTIKLIDGARKSSKNLKVINVN